VTPSTPDAAAAAAAVPEKGSSVDHRSHGHSHGG
jgi:hypothetical protein